MAEWLVTTNHQMAMYHLLSNMPHVFLYCQFVFICLDHICSVAGLVMHRPYLSSGKLCNITGCTTPGLTPTILHLVQFLLMKHWICIKLRKLYCGGHRIMSFRECHRLSIMIANVLFSQDSTDPPDKAVEWYRAIGSLNPIYPYDVKLYMACILTPTI